MEIITLGMEGRLTCSRVVMEGTASWIWEDEYESSNKLFLFLVGHKLAIGEFVIGKIHFPSYTRALKPKGVPNVVEFWFEAVTMEELIGSLYRLRRGRQGNPCRLLYYV